jgi:hypothetical protein
MQNKLLLNIAFLALSGFTATVNASLIQYDYTGNSFDTLSGGQPSSSHVDIKFVIDEGLVPTSGHASFNIYASPDYGNGRWSIAVANFNGIDSAPLWSNAATGLSKTLSISFDTDTLKNIVSWDMFATSNYDAPPYHASTRVSSKFDPSNALVTADGYIYSEGSWRYGRYVPRFISTPASFSATLQNAPGIWTKSSQITVPIPNAVPIPGAVWLFGSVVGGCLLTRRFSKS